MSQVAVVSGGNRGIGLEVVGQLAERDSEVVLGSRDLARGGGAAGGVGREKAQVRQLDVASDVSVDRFGRDLRDGFERVDVLVNNAAIDYDSWQTAAAAELAAGPRALG